MNFKFPIVGIGTLFVANAFVCTTSIGSEDEALDPLLRKRWIPDIREREIRSFHRIQSELFSTPHFVVKQDRWNRAYKIKKNGEVEYLLDSSYTQHFPFSEDTILAYYEALSLEKSRFHREAVHLLDGIRYCFQLRKPFQIPTEWESKVNSLANSLKKGNADREEFHILNDPYGCYHNQFLYLTSDRFHYQIRLPSDFSYEYSRNPDSVSIETNQYEARHFRLYRILDSKSERTWEDELLLGELGEKKFRKDKAIFFLGALREKQPVFNQDNFFLVWDNFRGIQSSTRREWRLSRKEKPPGYELRFRMADEKGDFHEWVVREYYYWNNRLGIFLSFSFPFREAEFMERIWSEIIMGFQVRQ